MHVASLELCKELFKLSRWDDCPFVYEDDETIALYGTPGHEGDILPAYDLGYLLRKLPEVINLIGGESGWVAIHDQTDQAWGAKGRAHADTPEDAACKLAIELWKQGVLK